MAGVITANLGLLQHLGIIEKSANGKDINKFLKKFIFEGTMFGTTYLPLMRATEFWDYPKGKRMKKFHQVVGVLKKGVGSGDAHSTVKVSTQL